MKNPRKISHPLALAVLVLLFEKAMHPYEMAATLKQRGKERSIKLRYGSLYTVIGQLEREGFIEAAGTERDGGRPERTTYRITDAGETEMSSWLRALLAEPVKEYPQFEAALSLLPALPPKDVQLLLAERLGRLEEQEREMQADLQDAAATNMPALFLVESEYALALVRAERAYVKGLVRGIETGELSGVEQWQQWHLDHKRN
ncbi:MAG TPA: PadR family transcriptional regulator [Steroidobacteraceae bacterium]|jgi:DNA-binding PadR family transcriptional regulator